MAFCLSAADEWHVAVTQHKRDGLALIHQVNVTQIEGHHRRSDLVHSLQPGLYIAVGTCVVTIGPRVIRHE